MAERLALTGRELLATQSEALDRFFGNEALPEPRKEHFEFIERTQEMGFSFKLFLEPNRIFTQDADFPGWLIRPNPYFWSLIKSGRLSSDAARLSLGWVALETVQKPPYDGGQQLYYDGIDPLGPVLEDLRKKGKIKIPDWCKHVPSISRFGISPLEIEGTILNSAAELMRARKVEQSPYMLFNFVGNLAYPEWGQTNTSEWFADKTGDGFRLLGGLSNRGGLACVVDWDPGLHNGHVGFRLLVRFPSQ